MIPENIRNNLKQYESYHNCTCLECGYQGHMGIKKTFTPWWATWWGFLITALLVLIFSGFNIFIGMIYGVVWALLSNKSTQKTLECPSCNVELFIKN